MDLRKHLRPVSILFIMAITSSIYTILDTSMLGFLTTDFQVGIYAAATKINRIVLNLVVSMGAVLLPRLSFYYGKNEQSKFYDLAYKASDLLMAIALPAAFGLTILAHPIITVMSGKEFVSAVPVMRAINPIVIIVSMSNFIGVQMFMPLKKEKWTLYSDIAGAIVNLIMNGILIPRYGALGAAVASVSAETVVTVIQLMLVRQFLKVSRILKSAAKYLVMALIMALVVWLTSECVQSEIAKLIVGISIGAIVYAIELLITKNEWAMVAVEGLRRKAHGNKE